MDLTIEDKDMARAASTPNDAPVAEPVGNDTAAEEAGEIRGMMPSFNVWQEAQHALKFERAAATVARERERAAARKRRWPLVIAACAVIAGALYIERSGDGSSPLLTASTPVDQLPWQVERAPSRAFRVTMPGDATSRTVTTAAGTGEEIEASVPSVSVRVAAFEVSGPSQARSLIDPVMQERAEALNGTVERVQGVGTRAGTGFESTIRTTTPVAVVRVIIDGAMMYVIELRGDIDSQRTKQIYDKVVLSFTPGA
jgi:hypothetical protein